MMLQSGIVHDRYQWVSLAVVDPGISDSIPASLVKYDITLLVFVYQGCQVETDVVARTTFPVTACWESGL